MKKYLKILPLLLYPYAYGIIFIHLGLLSSLVGELPAFYAIWIALTVLYSIWVFAITLRRVIGGFRQYTPTEAVKMNLAVKCWHIPAYITHFLIGVLGVGSTLISVNASGVGLIAFAVVIDLVTIFLSGLQAAGCVRRLKKEGVLSSETALLAGFGSFIYCVDIPIACYLVDLCKKKEKEAKLLQGEPLQASDGKKKAAVFKYLRALPLILYPYAYMIGFRFFGVYFIPFFELCGFIYTCLAFLFVNRAAVSAFREYTPLEAAGMNLVVKGLQIPAYISNFLSGAILGVSSGVWGIGFVAFFVLMDVFTIFLSGIYAVGCVRRLKEAEFLSSGTANLARLGSFVFVVDVIVAIVLVIRASKKAKELRRAEAAAAFAASVPQQDWQITAEIPLPPAPPTLAPVQSEAASPNVTSAPQQEQQTTAENPLPPPFVPTPPKPAPAPNETADETAREE